MEVGRKWLHQLATKQAIQENSQLVTKNLVAQGKKCFQYACGIYYLQTFYWNLLQYAAFRYIVDTEITGAQANLVYTSFRTGLTNHSDNVFGSYNFLHFLHGLWPALNTIVLLLKKNKNKKNPMFFKAWKMGTESIVWDRKQSRLVSGMGTNINVVMMLGNFFIAMWSLFHLVSV